jgi:predicted nucleic acid-binding protein
VLLVDVTEEIAVRSAKIKHERKMGLGAAIILAAANQEGAKIVTGDPHFKRMEGVMYLGT